ncbi:MAG: PD-(D/E)XK nuclease family protein [Gaiellaceae bacterium]
MARGKPVSPSAIDRYRRCPRQFYLCDIVELRGNSRQTLQTSVGRVIHAALQEVLKRPAEERSYEALAAALRKCWRTYCPKDLFAIGEEVRIGNRCLEQLRCYSETHSLDCETLGLECTLEAVLPGGARITGRIDRIDRLSDGRVRVIDHKTGHRWLEEEDLRTEPAARIYLLLASKQFGPIDSVRYHFLETGEDLIWEPEQEDLPYIAEGLAREVAEILSAEPYAPNPGNHCEWCPFRKYCAGAEAGATTNGPSPCKSYNRTVRPSVSPQVRRLSEISMSQRALLI